MCADFEGRVAQTGTHLTKTSAALAGKKMTAVNIIGSTALSVRAARPFPGLSFCPLPLPDGECARTHTQICRFDSDAGRAQAPNMSSIAPLLALPEVDGLFWCKQSPTIHHGHCVKLRARDLDSCRLIADRESDRCHR